MGSQLSIIVSSKLKNGEKQQLKEQVLSKWPFLRVIKEDDQLDHLLLSPPELTESVYDSYVKLEEAIEQNEAIRNDLKAFTNDTNGAVLVYIEAICFGDKCIYNGLACESGEIVEEQEPDKDGHIKLFNRAEIDIESGIHYFKKEYVSEKNDD